MRILLVLLVLWLPTAALAEIAVAGWQVSDKADAQGDCDAIKVTTDADGARRVVVVSADTARDPLPTIILNAGSNRWTTSGNITADLVVAGRPLVPGVSWTASKSGYGAELGDTARIVTALGSASSVTLRGGDGQTFTFDVRGIGAALGAVTYCQRRR